jgi:hypothetical protein
VGVLYNFGKAELKTHKFHTCCRPVVLKLPGSSAVMPLLLNRSWSVHPEPQSDGPVMKRTPLPYIVAFLLHVQLPQVRMTCKAQEVGAQGSLLRKFGI